MHSSVTRTDRPSRETSQITGYGPPQMHHRNVGYTAKRAKICIHGKGGEAMNWASDAFLWMTRRLSGPKRTTKFGVITKNRYNETSLSLSGITVSLLYFIIYYNKPRLENFDRYKRLKDTNIRLRSKIAIIFFVKKKSSGLWMHLK